MSTIILLPGAFHTSRCWARVVPLLEQHGHHVLTPDLAGIGDLDPKPRPSLESWAEQIAELVSAQPEPVILGGHSRGGVIVSLVAERIPERLAYLVYISGSLLPDGGSIATHGPQQEQSAPSPLEVRESGMATLRPEAARHAFLNRTPSEWAERAVDDLVAEPVWLFAEPIHITPARFGSVPRAYIETLCDNGVPIEVQRAWQAALPCDPVFSFETDHSPFYSDPAGLADALNAVAHQTRRRP